MTESERIIKEKILSQEFFIPETICGFFVDENRKRLWAILIDLLVQFDKVCRTYDLRYWVTYGGLLGIIRHDGFIPWDDDIDVCMPRDDYQKLLKHSNSFKNPYYLQIPLEEEGYYYSFARLRNCNTTGISMAFLYQNFNQGCNIDILPVDNSFDIDMAENASAIKELLILNSTNMKRSNPYLLDSDKQRLIDYPYQDPKLVFERMEIIATKHNSEPSEYVGTNVITFYSPEKMRWKKSDIYPLKEVPFYGHNVFIPNNPHNILKQTYNDYMEFPPIEKRGTWHGGMYYDPDVPYTKYVEFIRQINHG